MSAIKKAKSARPAEPVYPTTMPLGTDFCKLVSGPVWHVWNDISADLAECNEGRRISYSDAMEACLDANRITTAGYPGCDQFIDRMIKKYGYQRVRSVMTRYFKLGL